MITAELENAPAPTRRETGETARRSLVYSIRDGASYAVGIGLGETYVAACAVYLGMSDALIGLLATLPIFLGTCVQLVTPGIIDHTRSRKPLIVGGAALQALTWVPMIASLWTPRPWGSVLLFSGFILYFAFLHLTIPAWMSLMGDLVPSEIRGRYFSRRSATALFTQLLAVGAGGLCLSACGRAGREGAGFAVIFAGALLARGLSTWYLSRTWEPAYAPDPRREFSLRGFIRQAPASNFLRFMLFVGCMNAAAHFVGSLFNVYLLRSLGYTYGEFTAVAVAVTLAQIVAYPFWGRVADRFGTRQVIVVTSIGITLIPVLWMVSTTVAWACLAQIFSGLSWAGFNLCAGNFVLDAIPPGRRARCTAYLNVMTNGGVLLGGLAGAVMIGFAPDRIGPVSIPYPFWFLLGLSFLMRAGVLALFVPRLREVRDVPRIGAVRMLFHASREAAEAAVHSVIGWVRPGAQPQNRQSA
ncbi:MAG: MFS transporter [Planctomycetes bacterium]|nr:MFS transporter [Planctomycetota bacterium]